MKHASWPVIGICLVIGTVVGGTAAAYWPHSSLAGWVSGISDAQASFWGALVAAFLGFVALIAANFHTASLTIAREEQRVCAERRLLAAALSAEAQGIATEFKIILTRLYMQEEDGYASIRSYISLPEPIIYAAAAAKIGLLGTFTAQHLTMMHHLAKSVERRTQSKEHTVKMARVLANQAMATFDLTIKALDLLAEGVDPAAVEKIIGVSSEDRRQSLAETAIEIMAKAMENDSVLNALRASGAINPQMAHLIEKLLAARRAAEDEAQGDMAPVVTSSLAQSSGLEDALGGMRNSKGATPAPL